MNFKVLEQTLVAFIRDSVYKNNFKNGIVGVSGGIDSAVVLALAQRALGAKHTFGVLMPYRISSKESVTDALTLCKQLKVAHETVDISYAIDGYFKLFPTDEPLLIGNKCARERMSVLFDFSARKKALVVGTSNKSEMLIGYSTLYGDSAAAFLPLGDLYKTQVFELARHLKIPQEIIQKKPSADLWENQTDEGEIGVTYAELDKILRQLVDLRSSPEEVIASGHSAETVQKIQKMIVNSHYKRTMPPVVKIQNRTIGIDFRYPRDWNK